MELIERKKIKIYLLNSQTCSIDINSFLMADFMSNSIPWTSLELLFEDKQLPFSIQIIQS